MQERITRLIDDLDQSSDADETVAFGIDGNEYEIDLTEKNAAKLRHALQPYLDVARKRTRGRGRGRGSGVAGRPASRRGVAATQRSDPEQNRAIREWAKSRKMDVAPRGRIPDNIIEAYHASAGR